MHAKKSVKPATGNQCVTAGLSNRHEAPPQIETAAEAGPLNGGKNLTKRANHVVAKAERNGKSETPACQLIVLAERVARLVPSRRDPEAFFIEKSEIAHCLRRLAREGGR